MGSSIRVGCKESVTVDAGCFGPYVCWKRENHKDLHEAEIDVYPGREGSEKGVIRWRGKRIEVKK